MRPKAYVLCTSPRSGSTLLCKLLQATGMAGHPESHFHEPSLEAWKAAHGIRLADADAARQAVFAAALAEGKGDGTLFGLRLQSHSRAFFLRQLAVLHPDLPTDHARIDRAFGPAQFIYLNRRDRSAQAISYVKATQTGLWHRAADGSELERLAPARTPVYDAAALSEQIARFRQDDAEWRAWFASTGIQPLSLSYEALADDPCAALGQVLGHLGLDPALSAKITPPTARLADDTNHAWARRYAAQCAAPA